MPIHETQAVLVPGCGGTRCVLHTGGYGNRKMKQDAKIHVEFHVAYERGEKRREFSSNFVQSHVKFHVETYARTFPTPLCLICQMLVFPYQIEAIFRNRKTKFCWMTVLKLAVLFDKLAHQNEAKAFSNTNLVSNKTPNCPRGCSAQHDSPGVRERTAS